MQALIYKRPKNIFLTHLPDPQPGPDDVLIKTAYCGICGTDLHIIAGESPAAEEVVPGHEFSGTVIEVGSAVKNLQAGDRVCVDPNTHCGHCPACRQGKIHFCQNLKPIGVFQNGAMAQLCKAPASHVYKLPEKISLSAAALTEPVSCIAHGWQRLLPIMDNPSICILGSGLIGTLWGLYLREQGLNDILYSEPKQNRRQAIEQFGFRAVAAEKFGKEKNPAKTVFDVIIECSGNPTAIESAIPKLNDQGKFLLFGVCPQDSEITVSPFQIFRQELTILGSFINPGSFTRALDFLMKTSESINKLDIKLFSLNEYKEAFRAAGSGDYLKVMFDLGSMINDQ